MASNPRHDGPTIGLIDCPDCGPAQPARVLIRDEDHRPAIVCCLGCDRSFPADDVAWRGR